MFLRTANVLLGTAIMLYWALFLLCPYFQSGPPTVEDENIVFGASVSPSLDRVPVGFFFRKFTRVNNIRDKASSSRNARLTVSRLFKYVLYITLILSGDVELNPGPFSKLRFAHLNARSVFGSPSVDKPTLIQNYITDGNIDILALSETWLRPDSLPATVNSITPESYCCMHVPRPHGLGGGVAFIYRSSFEFRQITVGNFLSCEVIAAKLILNSASYVFINFYRPPSSSIGSFFDEFSSLLEDFATSPSEIYLSGDFNIRVDTSESIAAQFLALLEIFGLEQTVDFATHEDGHTLDLLIARKNTPCTISELVPTYLTFSDHLAFSCQIDMPVPSRPKDISKKIRLFKLFDAAAFTRDLLNSGLRYVSDVSLDLYVNVFISTTCSILDRHAPRKTVKCSLRPNKSFFTSELRAEKRIKSNLESKWRKNKSLFNFTMYRSRARHFAGLLRAAKKEYFKTLITKNADNSRKLWASLDKLIGNCKVKVLPTTVSETLLAKAFSKFFIGKISNLANKLRQKAAVNPQLDFPSIAPPSMSSFAMASEEEVRRVILQMNDATCDLDFIPTKKLKECIDGFIEPLTTIVNKCFSEGCFPDKFKHALVIPLLKKHSLPKEELSSYRPVSNLSFVSKVIEKVIQLRLLNHINSSSALPVYQSAYRMFYSTETALLRVQNDLLLAVENKKVSALSLLDLSAAFDTVDHAILIDRLRIYFGIEGSALSLLKSYLTGRTQSVQIGGEASAPVLLSTGVPQGSILGPLLFSLYTAPLERLLIQNNVSFHFYADDTQIYMHFAANECSESLSRLCEVLEKVKQWFCINRLSLNSDKTEFILFGTKQQRSKIGSDESKLVFDGVDIKPADKVRNLGVIFDKELSMTDHVSRVCQISFLNIRNLRRVRSSLDFDSAKLLANAIVASRLDYCNSLLNGANKGLINKLQLVQNSLARVVVPAVKRRDHITPTLKQLHWLPVQQRILFKLGLMTFKVIKNQQPSYLADLLELLPVSNRRSSSKRLLKVPFVRTETGRRSFYFASPSFWNSLPQELRDLDSELSFRKKLKTFLFPR